MARARLQHLQTHSTRFNLGRLRYDVVIEESEESVDDHGGMVESWSTADTVQADIAPATFSASERMNQDRFTTTITHTVTLRYYDGLSTSHRLTYNGRIFNIKEVIDVDGLGIMHQCECEEVTQ